MHAQMHLPDDRTITEISDRLLFFFDKMIILNKLITESETYLVAVGEYVKEETYEIIKEWIDEGKINPIICLFMNPWDRTRYL